MPARRLHSSTLQAGDSLCWAQPGEQVVGLCSVSTITACPEERMPALPCQFAVKVILPKAAGRCEPSSPRGKRRRGHQHHIRFYGPSCPVQCCSVTGYRTVGQGRARQGTL